MSRPRGETLDRPGFAGATLRPIEASVLMAEIARIWVDQLVRRYRISVV